MTNNLSFLFFIIAALVLFVGCSGPLKPDGFPQTYPCVITITQEGELLSKATVKLIPADDAKDWMTSAMTDESGRARMFTYGRFEGAPKGKFKVVVSKTETDPSKFTPPADENDEAAMALYNRNVMTEKLRDYTVIETIYGNPDTTPLDMEVKGRTTQTFDVGKKVRDVI
jgi:hypothetical protein